ncbi:DUF2975 domain-containing protein [Petrocella sp. FN5]|uniref:DUF2975 domain-containing protein n=1 Tax=Petrocella sp. FN5 TaxID=3032002 RepID=UPI0023DA6B00|nr:DUF2975 domain-containing protein [Petrocella sp. FN5]MDF1618772.1 DUF2975 domain-containing protein [Petrocella sp. FN5]
MKKRIWLPRILSVVMVLLMVVAVISIIFLPWIVTDYVNYAFAFTGITFIRQYYLGVLYGSGLLALAVLYELRRIFDSCVANTPFIMRNVTSLKRIGISAFIIGFIFTTKAIFFFTYLTLIVIFVFALASLFCFVLADVFEEAIHYKNENDLTI